MKSCLSVISCLLLFAQVPQQVVEASLEFDFSVIAADQSPRDLQTSGGTLQDLLAPSTTCDFLGGTAFFCDLYQRVGEGVGDGSRYMDLNISLECALDTTTGFDFRRTSCYNCQVLLTSSNASRIPKWCPCSVCPRDFGTSSVSIDCSHLIPNTTTTTANATTEVAIVASNATTEVTSASNSTTPADTTATPATPAANSSTTNTTSEATVAVGAAAPTTAPGITPVNNSSTAASGGAGVAVGAVAPTAAPGMMTRARHLQTAAPAPTAMETHSNTSNVTLPDPYIFATCVSVDCAGNCNGSCSLGCSDPTAQSKCSFCTAAAGQPTQAPTGEGGSDSSGSGGSSGGIPTIDEKTSTSGAGMRMMWSSYLLVGQASIMILLLAVLMA